MDKNGPNLARFTNTLLFAMFVVALAIAATGLFYEFTYDDAYIYYRYMDNLAAGHGFVFNVGERLEGYSSFLWLLIVGGAKIVTGFDTIVLAKVFGISMFGLALIVMQFAMVSEARRATGRYEVGTLLAIALVVFVILTPPATLWSLGGLENGLWSLVLMAYVVSVARWRTAWSALTICLLSITRVEAIAFAALPVAMSVVECFLTRREEGGFWRALRVHFLQERRNFYLVFYGSLLIFAAAVTAFRLHYFNDYLPATAHFKRPAGVLTSVSKGFVYLKGFVTNNPAFAIAFGVSVAMCWVWIRNRLFLAATLVVAAQLLFVMWVGGDWMGYSRFLSAFVPMMAITIGGALLWCVSQGRRMTAIAAIACIAIVAGNLAFTVGILKDNASALRTSKPLAKTKEVALFLRDHSAPEAVVAVGDAGIIPYYSERRIIDLHGLLDRHMLKSVGDFTNAGHGSIDADYVFSRNPSWFVMIGNSSYEKTGSLTAGYPLYGILRDHPDFSKYYRFYTEFELTYFYFYQLFYDTRQFQHYTIDVDLEVEAPGRSLAEFYVNANYAEVILKEFDNRKRTRVRFDMLHQRIDNLRFDPTGTINSKITIYGMTLRANETEIQVTPQQISQLTSASLKLESVSDEKVVFRATTADPVFQLHPLLQALNAKLPKG